MEQAAFAQLMSNFQSQLAPTIQDLQVSAAQPTAPIVVLVHGIGGKAQHWSDPVGVDINETWLFNTDAHPAYQADKLLTSPPYQPQAVTSWTQFLSANGISWVNFSQAHNQDTLQLAVDELTSILKGLESTVYGGFGSEQAPPLIILGHSRGGLVTRAATKHLGKTALPHLRKIITLHTPHYGSYMPKLSNDYNTLVGDKINFNNISHNLPGPLGAMVGGTISRYASEIEGLVSRTLKSTFGTEPSGVGFDELIPGSPMLQNLTQGEQTLDNVQYYSFGGNKGTVTSIFLGVIGQVVHLIDVAGLFLLNELAKIPEIHTNYGGLAELVKGDSAVSEDSSHWPDSFKAPHQAFPINHMQALVDKPLQNAVLQIIKA